MEGCCDIGGPKYPWPVVDREMKSSRVHLSPGCHHVIELGNDPRIVVLRGNHKWLQMVSLYEEHGILKPQGLRQRPGDHSTTPHDNLYPCS